MIDEIQLTTAEAEAAITAKLAEVGVTFDVSFTHIRMQEEGGKIREDDAWRVTLHKPKDAKAWSEQWTFPFYTGTGHRKDGQPVRPAAASILYCVLMDVEAFNQNFPDWASDFGYDSDSIRALGIYDACCEEARSMQRIFSKATIEELREILKDY